MLRWGLAASAGTLTNIGLGIGKKQDVIKHLSKIKTERII
jgi:hypothetical protein